MAGSCSADSFLRAIIGLSGLLDSSIHAAPVPRDVNYQLYTRYCRNADQLKSVFFAGRLGDYKYYNMDQAVARALTIFEKEFVE